MTDKEKEQKALEIYQQLINTLEDVPEKAEIITIVNTLIEENGLSPAGEPKTSLKTSRKKPESESVPLTCPKCGSTHVGRNGSAHGKSRFRCKDCGAFFGPTSGKLTQGSHTPDKAWDAFVEGMLCGDSLPVLSEKCGISLSTAHSWRMKLFSQVSNSVEGRILKGVIQEDEFYLPSSFKGNWKGAANLGMDKDYTDVEPDYRKYGFRNHPHERGSQDYKRGKGNVRHAFNSRLDQQSIRVTDKNKGSIKYAESTGLAHFALDCKTKAGKGQYNLRLVNSLHSIIAEISHSRFCFATKNAELYITWEAWKLLNRTKSLVERKDILKTLVVPGKRAASMQQTRDWELPSIVHQVSND
jgi:transposase-like protein